jgi:hypothetical protein
MAICNECGGKVLPLAKLCMTCSEKLKHQRVANRPYRTSHFSADEREAINKILSDGETLQSAAHAFTVSWYFGHSWTGPDGASTNTYYPNVEFFLLAATNKAMHMLSLKRVFTNAETRCGRKCLNNGRFQGSVPVPEVVNHGIIDIASIGAIATDVVSPRTYQPDGFGNSYEWQKVAFMHDDHAVCKSYNEFDCTLSRFYCELDHKPVEFFSFNSEIVEVAQNLSQHLFLIQNRTFSMNKPENPQPSVPAPANNDDVATALVRIADLFDRGLISEEEFQQAKNRVLGI